MSTKETDRIPCPVCGKTQVEEYDVCSVCNWENDPVQSAHPDLDGGANIMSLNQAIAAYMAGEQVK